MCFLGAVLMPVEHYRPHGIGKVCMSWGRVHWIDPFLKVPAAKRQGELDHMEAFQVIGPHGKMKNSKNSTYLG